MGDGLVEVKTASVANGMGQHVSLQHVNWKDHLKDRVKKNVWRQTYLGRPLSSCNGDPQWRTLRLISGKNVQILSKHF